MAIERVYSLCISSQKLRQLKEKKNTIVSHKCSPRWENFHNKNPKRVRFFDQKFFEDGIFIVKATKKTIQAREYVIKIEIEEQIL